MKKGLPLSLIYFAGLLIILTSCRQSGDNSTETDVNLQTVNSTITSSDKADSLFKNPGDLPVKYYPDGVETQEPSSVKETDDPLIISDFGTDGELYSGVEYPSAWVLFSEPIVPISDLGIPSDNSTFMEIDPPLKGVYRWYGTKLLSFEASEKGLPQHIYNISINEKLLSLGGKHLSGRNNFSFNTEYLSMVEIEPGRGAVINKDEVPVSEASRITVKFNYPVNLEVISKYLSVSSEGLEYRFNISRPDDPRGLKTKEELSKIAVLDLVGNLKEDSIVLIKMLKGAKSETNYIGTPRGMELSFKTISPFTFVSSYSGSHSYPGSYHDDSNSVFFEFSHPVENKNLNSLISSIPELTISNSNITVWNNIIKISNPDIEYNKSYTFYLSSDITDIYGRKLKKTNIISVQIPEAKSYSWFPNLGTHIIESALDPKIPYEFQNVFDGDWKVDSILDPYSSFRSDELGPYDFTGIEKNIRYFNLMDLAPWLSSAGTGYVGLSWNFQKRDKNGIRPAWGKRDLQVQVTDLAITTRYGYNKVVALISSLSTGKIIEGARVSLMRDRKVVKQINTDESGLAVFYLDDGEYSDFFSDSQNKPKDHLRFKVETDSDSIEYIPNNSQNIKPMGISNTETPLTIQKSAMKTLLFTDRGIYHPGETVIFRGIDRDLTLGEYSSFTGPYKIRLKESSYIGKTLAEEKGVTSESGGFYGKFELADNLSPGKYNLVYSRSGGIRSTYFQVANFEKHLFSINLDKPDLIYFPDQKLSFPVHSTYFTGGALSSASYSYTWTKKSVSFNPGNTKWSAWSFGPGNIDQQYTLSSGEGFLDSEGRAVVEQISDKKGVKGLPYSYSVELRVKDKSNQVVVDRQSAIVHPASFYIGMKLVNNDWSGFLEKGDSANIEFALVDPSGNIINSNSDSLSSPFKIKMELFHKNWESINEESFGGKINTRYREVEDLETSRYIADVSSSTFKIQPLKVGSYIVRLSSKDYSGREVVTNLSFYSTGGDWIRWGKENTRNINLVSDKVSYEPGETAKILIKSPLPEGQYLITTEREGIFDERVVYLKGGAQVVGVPVQENYIPVVYVSVSSWSKRSAKPSDNYFEPDPDKPKGYFGITPINIDSSSRQFNITLESDKTYYLPGDEVQIKVKADYHGAPLAGAEITLMAVDTAVPDYINSHVPNPVKFFYSKDKFPFGVRGGDSRSLLLDPVSSEAKALQGVAPVGDISDKRVNYKLSAIFEPYILTNSMGEASVSFTLPDNITSYCLTAIGAKEDKFAVSEKEILAGNPISVKKLIPQTLRFRDLTISGLSLTNLSDKDEKVSVKADSDILIISGSNTVERTIPAGKTEIFNFYLSAVNPGKGAVHFSIRSNIFNKDLQADLRILNPYESAAFISAGRIVDSVTDRGHFEDGLLIPSSSNKGTGSLSLTLSPGIGGELKNAVDYLAEYPYNSMEQRSSKLIPKIIFKNDPAFIAEQFKVFAEYQNNDGGIPFWPDSWYKSSYYVSLRVAFTYYLLQKYGITVDQKPDISKLLSYLSKPDKQPGKSNYLMAFKYYILSLNKQDISAAYSLLETEDPLGINVYAMLGLAFAESGNKQKSEFCLEKIKQYIKLESRTIDITEIREGNSFYGSESESLSLLLLLLNKIDPEGELVMRTANTISLKKKNGYWRNTVDTSWAILALSSGLPDTMVDFNAEVNLSNEKLLSVSFTDSNDAPVEKVFRISDIPLKSMERDTSLNFSIDKNGPGNLFYTASLKYTLPVELLAPRDEGFGLYSSISDRNGRIVDTSKLLSGKTYIQKIIISSTKDRQYLSLRVPVPSGAVIIDTSSTISSVYPDSDGDTDSYSSPWKEIMDNEVRYFFDSFKKGKKEIEFYFRPGQSGIYPTPPIQAECMYQPEISGRTSGKLITITEN